ncbi:MAG TPA: serine/threonine-protein kinase [Kofleriaceae bacterium]|jgi:serine/threonine-protein kinase
MSGSELVGTVLAGRYRVTRQLGQGGMGAVYEAVNERLDKRVAIKVLLEAGASGAAIARFEQEARLASAIGNEHIIDIVDIDRSDGHTYIVMELLDGSSLAQLLGGGREMPERRIAGLGAQAARALAAAHDKGIVHRDIKPENLFVIDRGGRDFLKIVDFGISKLVGDHGDAANLTRSGTVIGTAAYMSPEQARGDDVDARADIYSLGVVLYRAATGKVPFEGDNVLKVLNLVVSSDATPPRVQRPELSAAFERIVMTAMAPRREDRYATASALADALEHLAEAGESMDATAPTVAMPAPRQITAPPAPTAPTSPTVATPTFAHRRRWLPIVATLLAAAVAAGVVVVSRRGGSPVVDVVIHSKPEGAWIFDEDRMLGQTPLAYRFGHEDRIVHLTAQLAGFDIACFKVDPADDNKAPTVRMPAPGTGCGNSTTRPAAH